MGLNYPIEDVKGAHDFVMRWEMGCLWGGEGSNGAPAGAMGAWRSVLIALSGGVRICTLFWRHVLNIRPEAQGCFNQNAWLKWQLVHS